MTPSRETAPTFAPPAVVVIENHTDFAWRVAFGSVSAAPATVGDWLEVAPRAVRRVELAGGVYHVRREVVAVNDARVPRESPDSADLRLYAGRTYTWPLGTLFSSEGAGP